MAVRRTDVDDMARRVSAGQLSTGRMNKMSLGGGHYRNHLFWYPLFEAKTARAWCIGDPAALADLLGDVQYLGRKRSNGHGRIEEIEIRDAPEAVSLWMHRVMPWEVPGYVPVTAATEPPYWSPETQRSAWQPMELVPART
jgi:CRISPR type IV-associated protein Csf3